MGSSTMSKYPVKEATVSKLTVAKFGGTSVANYEAMVRCGEIIKNDPSSRLVVVSASAGVTNTLVELAKGKMGETERSLAIAKIAQY